MADDKRKEHHETQRKDVAAGAVRGGAGVGHCLYRVARPRVGAGAMQMRVG
jgi:hypothetical protein